MSTTPTCISRTASPLLALVALAGCAHEQGFDLGRPHATLYLPALAEGEKHGDLSSDRFLQLVDRTSWPKVVIEVPRSTTVHGPTYVGEAEFARQGQPWDRHPTLESASRAEPGRGDDVRAFPAEVFKAALDFVLMPPQMIFGPQPHEPQDGPEADWSLWPERAAFDPGWFQPMGTAESPHSGR